MSNLTSYSQVEDKIITLRNQPVLLANDVAELYEVETMRVNEAVKNNPEKFPNSTFIFELSKDEKQEVIEIFDNPKVKFSPALPKAFTEKGLYMLATILKSPKATDTTIEIVETFAKLKELSRTVAQLSEIKDEKQQKSLMQKSGELMTDLLGSEMQTTDSETTIELNFAMLKLKHTIKQKKK